MNFSLTRVKGGSIAVIGFILSPISWWNDMFVNFPLAYIFAMPFAMISEDYFTPMLIVGYWLTNIAGIIMMRLGVTTVAKDTNEYTRKAMAIDLFVAFLYTVGMLGLIHLGIIKPLSFD